jgi:hypothetical protein
MIYSIYRAVAMQPGGVVEMSMKMRMLVIVVMLVSSCCGQTTYSSPNVISRLFSKAHISGSLWYWSQGVCESKHERYPAAPAPQEAAVKSLDFYQFAPQDILRKLFADDSQMQITQESGGIVRIFEHNVPTDLLEVKIHQISFDFSEAEADSSHGPNIAVRKILSTPEVQAFKRAHQIGPASPLELFPPDAVSRKESVTGSLKDVTVLQALDYIFKTFPGLWLYGNCRSPEDPKNRSVYFWFIENSPETNERP